MAVLDLHVTTQRRGSGSASGFFALHAALDDWKRSDSQSTDSDASWIWRRRCPSRARNLPVSAIAGWSAELRSAGQVAIALEVCPNSTRPRRSTSRRSVHLRVEIEAPASAPAACRAAVERLLLERATCCA